MNIIIDQDRIEEAITSSATKALGDAFGGWEARNAIAGIITKQIAEDVMVRALQGAVSSIDTSALTAHLAEQIQKTVTSVVIGILREGLVEVVCKLRGIGTYGDDVAKRKAVSAELFRDRD